MAHAYKGFNMSSDAIWEMRRLLEKRVKSRFSEGLSNEGKQAMELAREDSRLVLFNDEVDGSSNVTNSSDNKAEVETKNQNHEVETKNKTEDNKQQSEDKGKTKNKIKDRKSAKSKKQAGYSGAFNRNSSVRMDGDITDENFSEADKKKRAIGGGKPESAMETVEIVNYENEAPGDHDEVAIAETAKLGSVEKCIVWMEVNNMEDAPKTETPADTSKTDDTPDTQTNTSKTDDKPDTQTNTSKTDDKPDTQTNTSKTDEKPDTQTNTSKTDNKPDTQTNTSNTDDIPDTQTNTSNTDDTPDTQTNTSNTDDKPDTQTNTSKTDDTPDTQTNT